MRLPFETDHVPGASRQVKKWLEVLDDLGMENVRIRLAQSSSGPDGAFYGAGSDIAVPRGFAEDWLRYRDRRSRVIEQRWRWAIFIPACIGALAACAGGTVILAPRLSSYLHSLRASNPTPAPPASVAAAPAPASPAAPARPLAPWRPVAAGERVVIKGNIFEAEAGVKPEAIQRVESPDVVRFQMIAGNRWSEDSMGGDERTELDGYKQPFEIGVPYWVAWSIYIEPGPRFTADWIALGQVPGLMGHILKQTIMTWSLAGKSLHSALINQGQSYQFVEKFIVDPVNGYYGSWLDGKQVVDYHGRVGDPGRKYYYKIGIYRGAAQETMAVRYANYKFGTADLSELIANPDPVPPLLPWP
jgi:large repetitive protein